jgi:membrane-associated phospholipid phosphatase
MRTGALILNGLAHLVSIVFHPLFVPFPAVWLVLQAYPVTGSTGFLFLLVFVFSALLPMGAVGLLKLSGRVTSLTLNRREERRWPLFAAALGSLFQALILFFLKFPPILAGLALSTACIISLAMLITRFWKISIHMAGWGGFAAVFAAMAGPLGIGAGCAVSGGVLIAALVGWARVYLHAHNPAQVVAGFAMGAVLMGLGLSFFL